MKMLSSLIGLLLILNVTSSAINDFNKIISQIEMKKDFKDKITKPFFTATLLSIEFDNSYILTTCFTHETKGNGLQLPFTARFEVTKGHGVYYIRIPFFVNKLI